MWENALPEKKSTWHFYCAHGMSSMASHNKTCRIQETRPGCGQADRSLMGLWRKNPSVFSVNFISTENEITNFAFYNTGVKVTGIKQDTKSWKRIKYTLNLPNILAFSMDKLMLFTKVMISFLTSSLPWVNY